MNIYAELLILFSVGMAPTVMAVVFLIYKTKVHEGSIALVFLFVTCGCSFLAMVIKFRRDRHATREMRPENMLTDSENPEDIQSPYEIMSPGGEPPKYEQLYPCKSTLSPSESIHTSSSTARPQMEPTLYVNPCSEFLHSSTSCQEGSLERQNDEEGLPSYSEAIAALESKQIEP
ncbi:uncharacterized protein [Palaemon carinicauda]|uniref:uncharacterized protein n=1 Tax=Palaemon carinicauda TaxID=392227 RepID=UPI0035B6A28A